MKKEIREVIDCIVNKQLVSIMNGTEILPGHNGPYYDNETKARNLSHWICIFGEYYVNKKEEKYKKVVEKLAKYYKSNKDFSKIGLYECRKSHDKDHVNGTIGQAWIIEGLIMAYKITSDNFFIDRAINIFNLFPFDEKNGLWSIIDIDGHNYGIDMTYNHQLWFAASGAEILNYKSNQTIFNKINIFLQKSKKNFKVLPSGLIYHFVCSGKSFFERLKNNLKYIKHILDIKLGKPSLEYKEIGYHIFNVYGFAILQEKFSKHFLFNTSKFNKAIKFCISDEYGDKLFNLNRKLDITKLSSNNVDEKINTYGFPYNSPAFELPYALEKFDLSNDIFENKLLNYQLNNFYDFEKCSFSNNTEDENVLNSRIYELVKSEYFWKEE